LYWNGLAERAVFHAVSHSNSGSSSSARLRDAGLGVVPFLDRTYEHRDPRRDLQGLSLDAHGTYDEAELEAQLQTAV